MANLKNLFDCFNETLWSDIMATSVYLKNYFKTTFTVLKTLSSFKYTYMVKWWLEFSVLHDSKMKFEAHSATERGMAEFSAYSRNNEPFNNALDTFDLRLNEGKKEMFYLTTHSTHFIYIRHMVENNSDSERGNLLPPHGLLFPINSKGYIICIIP